MVEDLWCEMEPLGEGRPLSEMLPTAETERQKETEILGSPFFLLSNLLIFLPLAKPYEHPVGKGA